MREVLKPKVVDVGSKTTAFFPDRQTLRQELTPEQLTMKRLHGNKPFLLHKVHNSTLSFINHSLLFALFIASLFLYFIC